ncbi:acyl-CoA dehydrogenase family protein [Jeotgalibacillus proteolyticus]|uniref:acyl-CoA dehydrogenase family protein n=1 Tax=Jeotgalibacillus proteolyticus TaxID=2082395 RepID=UPI003CE7CDB4
MYDFIRTDEQRAMVEELKQLLPAFKQREPELSKLHSVPAENINDLINKNYHTLTVPEEFGGQDKGLYDFILAQETIAWGSGATALSIGWHGGALLEWSELRHWREDAISWLLPKISDGALINTAATEKGAGSPTRGALPRTTAAEKEGHWVINGEKSFTSLAPLIDYFLVTATIAGTENIATFIVPATAKGVSIKETWDSVGMRGTASHDLVMQDVIVQKNHLLKEHTADKRASSPGWLLHIPACYIGIAGAAREEAVSFAAGYVPASLGEPIGNLPTVQQQIGEIDIELTSARQILYHAALAYEEAADKDGVKDLLQSAKVTITNSAISIVDKAMRIVGPSGMSASSPMQRFYNDVRMGIHNPPMEDMVKASLGSGAIKFHQNRDV